MMLFHTSHLEIDRVMVLHVGLGNKIAKLQLIKLKGH